MHLCRPILRWLAKGRLEPMSESKKRLVIAIDGPSGTGKSSVSRGLAKRLQLSYLDTGAMYRAMTWHVLNEQVDPQDKAAVVATIDSAHLESGIDPNAPTISIHGIDVSGPIRESDVTNAVSAVSAVPEVRAHLVELQRSLAAVDPNGIVVEGRDIANVVLPDATLKIFLTADPVVRAARRAGEYGGDPVAVQNALTARDVADSSRTASPMTQTADAIEVDTTHMTLEEVIDTLEELAMRCER